MRLPMLREIFPGSFNRPLSCKGPEYQRLFLFKLNSASGNGLQFRSIQGEHIHFAFTQRFFPAEAIENQGSRVRFTENLSKSFLQQPNLRQKVLKRFPFFKH